MILEIRGLHAGIDDKKILNGVSLSVGRAELVSLMGPNGSGKTSLAYIIAGHPRYKIYDGRILFEKEDITDLSPDERSLRGIFLAFQNPPEISGLRLLNFMLASYNKRLGHRSNLLFVHDASFLQRTREYAGLVGLGQELLYREVNVGFSGGERKRAEFLQALLLKPKLAILDEPDSGLDADGLEMIGRLIRKLIDEGTSVLLITHYTRIYRYVEPSRIYVMHEGRIVAEGGLEIARAIDEGGYRKLMDKVVNND
jgi:Fe-S cluster assembly ATP-binding protein